MPVLGGLIASLFGGLVASLMAYVSRKVAFGIAMVTMMSGLTLGLYIAMRLALSTLSASLGTGLPEFFFMCLQMAIPPAASACLSTYVTVWTACTVYTWQKDLLIVFGRS